MFNRIMPFTQITNQFLFDNLRGKDKYISIFELIAGLVITAFSTYTNKMRLLYVLFDFDNSGSITIMEMMFIYEAVIQVICKLTGQPPPLY